ncbi:glycosyltransferase [Rossellomorea sp. AcN35-11]|nr:glycosyltransferase [Rossellomorea aquimaris]WJV29537.1 glycosyltransferase [Rossellomorea sp. AcN35-11]
MSANGIPLLTAYLFISAKSKEVDVGSVLLRLTESRIVVKVFEPDEAIPEVHPKHPRVYVTLGPDWKEFDTMNGLSRMERRRWLHYSSPDDIEPQKLFYCWLMRTDPFPETKPIPSSRFTTDLPLVSVFTAAYRSGEKIKRPYRSLLNQTYPNWEWVIIDDSGDKDETYLRDLQTMKDPRVRCYRQDSRSGYIGAVKRYAASLCTGEILVEVDHDDELTPDCLQKIVDALTENPQCGFAYGDCSEVYEDSKQAHWYGWDSGFGYSVYYRVWVPSLKRWQNVNKHTAINGSTIRHLVGLPNHPRAWTRECYHLIGGHREELMVADDYDMLIRTFLATTFVAVPDLLYIQYRNGEGNNSTFIRNQQIQILVKQLRHYYHERMYQKVREKELPEEVPYQRIWNRHEGDKGKETAHVIHEKKSHVSILFPIPYSCKVYDTSQLIKTLQKGVDTHFRDLEVVVIGRIPPEVETYAPLAPMGSIRWWPMEPEDSLETCIRYGKYCASCHEKIVVLP